jgi:hypothetical protein
MQVYRAGKILHLRCIAMGEKQVYRYAGIQGEEKSAGGGRIVKWGGKWYNWGENERFLVLGS